MRERRMNHRWTFLPLGVLFTILIWDRPAYAGLALYDDFNDPAHLVRADLWNVFTSSRGSLSDAVRVVDALIFPTANPKLLIGRRLVVPTGADAGSDLVIYSPRNAPSPLGVQADVTLALCLLTPDAFVLAGVSLFAFNDGTPGDPGDSTGDIFAQLRAECTGPNQAELTWRVFRCDDSTCGAVTILESGSFGLATLGQQSTLNVTKSGGSFVFTANGQVQNFPVPGGPTAPARSAFNGNGVVTQIFSLLPANGGEFAVIATFDNVMIDQ